MVAATAAVVVVVVVVVVVAAEGEATAAAAVSAVVCGAGDDRNTKCSFEHKNESLFSTKKGIFLDG